MSYEPEQAFEANSSIEFLNQLEFTDEQHVGSVLPEAEANVSNFAFTENTNIRSINGWRTGDVTLKQFEQNLLKHTEVTDKFAAGAFIPGSIQGDRRLASAVMELSAVVLDLDAGEDIEAVCGTIESMGLGAVIHSTYSHNETQAEIRIDAYRDWCGSDEVDVPGLRGFLCESPQS